MSVNVPQGVIDNILTRLTALEQNTAASPAEQLTPSYLLLNPDGGVGLDSRYLATANNLSDVPDPTLAIDNLGALDAAENLADVANATTALQNLGIGWPARAFCTGPASSPAGTYPQWVQVPLDTVNNDPTGQLSTVGIGLAYTVPVTGYYLITASVQVILRGSIQPPWIFSLNDGLVEMNRGMETVDFTTGSQSGNLGLVIATLRGLSAGDIIYPVVYAPYQFTYETAGVGAVSNDMSVIRLS